MSVKIKGLDLLRRNINRNIAEHHANVMKALSECGDVAVYESVLRAPKKEGMLEISIEKELGDGSQGPAVAVVVPGNSPAAAYATAMHEDDYNLGNLSEKKQGKAGVEVGRKYITRGIDAGKEKYETIIRDRLTEKP